MKKIIILAAFVTMMMPAGAQKTMRDVFLSMPDSISTGLNANMRQELVDFAAMKAEAKVKNLFQGEAVLDTIHGEYVSLKLNKATTMQMRLLSDSVVCLVKTFMAPEPESEIHFYSLDWKHQDYLYGLENLSHDVEQFVQRPDTMTVERFDELCRMIEPVMLAAELSPTEEKIMLTLSAPLLNSEERKAVKAILLQRKYRWNGNFFKENDD